MSNPLNPTLYNLLVREFGKVMISNEGEEMVSRYGTDFLTGKEKLHVENAGEQYRICCPACTDTRFRLYISHRWGVADDKGHRNHWLMVCHNEHCFSNQQTRDDFTDRLSAMAGVLGNARLKPGKIITEATESSLPGPHYFLNELDSGHAANRYLASRLYDHEMLGRFYRVGYCPDSMLYLARHRIIAPVYFRHRLMGWQARHIGDLDWHDKKSPPKWWSDPHMKKSMLLYNYDNAIQWQTGVIVEGPSSNWGFGPMATATLGSSISMAQTRHLVSGFRNGSLVLLWDPDVRNDEKKMKHLDKMLPLLRGSFRHGFAEVWLPEGGDPGTYDRGWMWDYVAHEAGKQGVKVSWKRR